MAIQTLTGEDVFLINDYPLMADTANGDIVTIDFPNDLATMTTGKNKNTIYAKNEAGSNIDITCKLMRGGKADKFLNGLQAQQERDFVGFTLMNGAFVKRLGDGAGNITYDTYNIQGMIFTKAVPGKASPDGDGDQATATYTMKAAVATRGIV